MRCALNVVPLLLVGVAVAQPEQPASSPPVSFYVGGGASSPMSPAFFKDGWNRGWNLGGGLGYRFSRSEIRALVFYNDFGLTTYTGISGGNFRVLEIMGEYKFHPTGLGPDGPVALYLIGGVGVGVAEVGEASFATGGTTPVVAETKLAYDLGGGIDIVASPSTSMFVEAKYVVVTTDDEATAYVPVRVGLRFSPSPRASTK